MNKNEMKQKLIDMLITLFPNANIDPDIFEYVDLIDDLGMDSMTFISYVVNIELVFGLSIPDNVLLMENFRTVDRIISIIEVAQNGSQPNAIE